MQRCMSIMTIPSGRFQVAFVGQTRTHGGLSQWLQSTTKSVFARSLRSRPSRSSGKAFLNGSFHIHFISCRLLFIAGTLCERWQAVIQSLQSALAAHFVISITMAHRTAADDSNDAAARTSPPKTTSIPAPAPVIESPRSPAFFRNSLRLSSLLLSRFMLLLLGKVVAVPACGGYAEIVMADVAEIRFIGMALHAGA